MQAAALRLGILWPPSLRTSKYGTGLSVMPLVLSDVTSESARSRRNPPV